MARVGAAPLCSFRCSHHRLGRQPARTGMGRRWAELRQGGARRRGRARGRWEGLGRAGRRLRGRGRRQGRRGAYEGAPGPPAPPGAWAGGPPAVGRAAQRARLPARRQPAPPGGVLHQRLRGAALLRPDRRRVPPAGEKGRRPELLALPLLQHGALAGRGGRSTRQPAHPPGARPVGLARRRPKHRAPLHRGPCPFDRAERPGLGS
mmetsp:Transcript_31551/g.88895  ORF Transcript_31551/g.88895 Transcript_31551/m.88895 type:complete len:206 (-) Transcript_31551:103-720(-)